MFKAIIPAFLIFLLSLPVHAQEPADAMRLMIMKSMSFKEGAHFLATLEIAIDTAPDRAEEFVALALEISPDQEKEIMSIAVGAVGAEAGDLVLPTGQLPQERLAEIENEERAQRQSLGFFSTKAWDGELSLGGSLLTGNTSEKALSVGLKLARVNEIWEHHFAVQGDYSRNANQTTKERILSNYNSKWFAWKRGYLFGLVDFELDSFSEFDWRTSQAVGGGYRVIERENMALDLEGGPGVRETKLASDGVQFEFVGVARSNYSWQITDALKFIDIASVFVGSDRTTFSNDAGLTAKFTKRLSGRLSFYTKYDTSVPENQENLDTATRATIVYDF